MAPHIVHAKFSLKLLPPSISHICRCIALYTVLISQTCQRDSQPFFVAGKKLSETRRVVKNGSWQTAAAREGGEERGGGEGKGERMGERRRNGKREYMDEKREEAEGRTCNSAVITCSVSYSPWGDTRSISIQRISCRVLHGGEAGSL